ncbi:hypothetical protein ACFGVR_02535 [Mucilaginibacter sp. AW1-3]
MKKSIFLVSLLLLTASLFAQSYTKSGNGKPYLKEIGFLIARYYHPNEDSVKNTCWEGCVFIRFNINSKNQFTNIAYTISTPPFIKNGLADAFNMLNQRHWIGGKLNNLEGKTYIQPIIIANNDGCGFMTGWEDSAEKRDAKKEEMYKKKQDRFDQSFTSIQNITNFTDGKIGAVDCILLPVVITGIKQN